VSLFDIRRRDCLAREGTFSHGALSILTPGIIDIPAVFPDLDREVGTNVPLSADPAFVSRYRLPVKGKGSPAVVHPLGEEQVAPGDLVVVANWHTVLSRPRDFVRHLAVLKEMVPPDTAWYAPASALPSNAALLVYAGFDLFDCVAADLAAARGSLCLPEGVFPAGKADDGIQVPRGPIPGPEGPQPPGTAPPQSRGAPAPLDSSGSFGPVAPSEPGLPAGPGIPATAIPPANKGWVGWDGDRRHRRRGSLRGSGSRSSLTAPGSSSRQTPRRATGALTLPAGLPCASG
jgi:hypothetical protein